jgi:hypothetical protein
MTTPRNDNSADLMADFEMWSVRTLEFGPGTNMIVKYSFFLIFLDFPARIIPPRLKDARITA